VGAQVEATLELLPALGFFGTKTLCLTIPVTARVYGFRVSIEDPAHHILNLQSISFMNPRGRVNPDIIGARFWQSSFHESDTTKDPSSVSRGDGIHTGSEKNPAWEVTFSEQTDLSLVRIENRADGWGCRSRTLKVEAAFRPGEWAVIHYGWSPDRVLQALAQASTLLGPLRVSFAKKYGDVRRELLEGIASSLLRREVGLEDIDWATLIQFVRLWKSETITDEEMLLMAGMALRESRRGNCMTMLGYSLCLDSAEQVIRFQDTVDSVATLYELGQYVVTRHGVQQSKLLSKREAFLDAAESVIKELESIGSAAMLCYGSLLGAVRDGAFIPHDDDLDILYSVDANSIESAREQVQRIRSHLQRRGYQVVSNEPYGLNMHVLSGTGVSTCVIDIFPCWEVNGRVFLHMERMRIRDLSKSDIFPVSRLKLYGREFPAPSHPTNFLTERYGKRWDKPDRLFEWPWELRGT